MPLTHADRLKGAKKSLEKRRNRQHKRRKKAKALHDTGMPITKIAVILGVNYRTISKDLKEVSQE